MDDAASTSTATPRQQVADQVTKSLDVSKAAGGDGSLLSQLTGNPFFTAVRALRLETYLDPED